MSEAIVSGLVAAAVAFTVSFLQLRQIRSSARATWEQDLNAKYDRLIDYRLKHPEVLSCSRRWTPDCFARLYSDDPAEATPLVVYYGYVEVAITYCNAVLFAHDKGLLDDDVYQAEHEPLMRILLAAHQPILAELVKPDDCVTKRLHEYVASMESGGWNWQAQHEALLGGRLLGSASGAR